jgi:hypothetical protein
MARLEAEAIGRVILVSRWGAWANNPPEHGKGKHWLADDAAPGAQVRDNPALFKKGLEVLLEKLRSLGKQVVVVGSVPEAKVNVWAMLARLTWWERSLDIRSSTAAFQNRQRNAFRVFDDFRARYGITVIYPHETLCDSERCMVEDGGKLILRDDNHLTELGALRLAPVLRPAFVSSGS